LALSWPNSATMVLSELGGRTYGGGVLKLETREAEKVLVPALTEKAAEHLERRAPAIDHLLRTGQHEAVADLVDPVVLATLDPHARAALREAWLDLRGRRKRRSSPARTQPVAAQERHPAERMRITFIMRSALG
jgi:adenine-specific DNA-methyltransferase